jgi:hypothetical protein
VIELPGGSAVCLVRSGGGSAQCLVVGLPGGRSAWWWVCLVVGLPGGGSVWWWVCVVVGLPGGGSAWWWVYLYTLLYVPLYGENCTSQNLYPVYSKSSLEVILCTFRIILAD